MILHLALHFKESLLEDSLPLTLAAFESPQLFRKVVLQKNVWKERASEIPVFCWPAHPYSKRFSLHPEFLRDVRKG